MTDQEKFERHLRIEELKIEIQVALPEFAKLCQAPVDAVLMCQAAFAGDFQMEEYTLLGKAIKYAGLCGKTVNIIHDETCK